MLSTAIVKIKDKHGHFQNCRALLDCGSEGSFITKQFCDKLGLIKEGISVNVMGINQNVSTIKHRVALEIESMQFPYKSTISCFVLNKITENIPSTTYDLRHFEIPDNIKLTDKYFYKSGKIDILLGANIFWNLICKDRLQQDIFWNLICKDRLQQDTYQPILQKTLLGWIFAGYFGT
ncbi:putative peptidase (DUF1758) [Popillia japonica]|uniref:Peptidase (DUF1758) n=1 Tax=Popillia japonica TaxID=7064 RepID=A0AAW1HWQ8_POPJA